jgi:hypothetical protein
MDILKNNIYKISLLLLIMSISSHLMGQLESGDSISNNLISEDTVISENILKTPEMQVEKTPPTVFPTPSTIPMLVPELKYPDLMMPPRYLGYEDAKNRFRYTAPMWYEPGKLNLNLPPPPKSILDLIRENPFRALFYGAAMLAGMVNHNIVGEDKMNIIRLNDMVQSRLGIPETAISGQGAIYYEIDIKRHK